VKKVGSDIWFPLESAEEANVAAARTFGTRLALAAIVMLI
jgi:hypothetical protein